MRKYSGDLEASGALHIHEEAVGGLDEALKLVLLVLIGFGGVEEILGHFICGEERVEKIRVGRVKMSDVKKSERNKIAGAFSCSDSDICS